MMKRKATVVLHQQSINSLFSGKPVIIRLEDIELEVRFDPSARMGSGSMEDLIADVLRKKS